jgi:hypothetical protein
MDRNFFTVLPELLDFLEDSVNLVVDRAFHSIDPSLRKDGI